MITAKAYKSVLNKTKKPPASKPLLNPNLYRALLITLLVLAIAIQGGLDFQLYKNAERAVRHTVKQKHVTELFSNASHFTSQEDRAFTIFSNKDTIGTAIPTYAYAKGIKGFSGEVPVLIGLNKERVVQSMVLLKHHESQEYMEYIIDEELLSKWNGKTLKQAANLEVDAITAATETSEAIIRAVNITFASLGGEQVIPHTVSWQVILQYILTGLTIVFALLVCYVKSFKKYRTLMLLMVAVVLGFMYKTMLSVSLLHGWAINGLPWSSSTVIVILLLLCIVLPFTTKKQFYCHYMCPYGAVQELAGKISPVKKKKSMKWLKYKDLHLQTVLFIILMVGLLTGVYPELSFIEPFPSFSYEVVSWGMIGFGLLFIGLSFFYAKPWCKICPTGFIFDSCKKQNKKVKTILNMKTSEILNLLLVVVIILLLLKVGNINNGAVEKAEVATEEAAESKGEATANNNVVKDTTHFKKSIGKRPTMFPLPAVVIGSYDANGKPNIMTASWAGIVNSRPLSMSISLREATHTYKNVMESGAFTLNYANEDLLPYADWAGEFSGKDYNKFDVLGLTPVKSELVNAPYVKEFPVVVELKVIKSEKLGRHTQFIGEVIDTKVDTTYLIRNRVDIKKMKPILVGSGGGYYGFGEHLGRPGKLHKTLGIKVEEKN